MGAFRSSKKCKKFAFLNLRTFSYEHTVIYQVYPFKHVISNSRLRKLGSFLRRKFLLPVQNEVLFYRQKYCSRKKKKRWKFSAPSLEVMSATLVRRSSVVQLHHGFGSLAARFSKADFCAVVATDDGARRTAIHSSSY